MKRKTPAVDFDAKPTPEIEEWFDSLPIDVMGLAYSMMVRAGY